MEPDRRRRSVRALRIQHLSLSGGSSGSTSGRDVANSFEGERTGFTLGIHLTRLHACDRADVAGYPRRPPANTTPFQASPTNERISFVRGASSSRRRSSIASRFGDEISTGFRTGPRLFVTSGLQKRSPSLAKASSSLFSFTSSLRPTIGCSCSGKSPGRCLRHDDCDILIRTVVTPPAVVAGAFSDS